MNFMDFAHARYEIFLKRKAGEKFPWTNDPILRENHFCNIFREDDRTTIWFRENIRDPMKNDLEVIDATMIFRWFNRIETGEKMLRAGLFSKWNSDVARVHLYGVAPLVTSAYMVKSPAGLNKLEGLCESIDVAVQWTTMIKVAMATNPQMTLEHAWGLFAEIPEIGPFMAYEIVTDLRHTRFLQNAPDIMTWCSPGPGACRGMARMLIQPVDLFKYSSEKDRRTVLNQMRKELPGINAEWKYKDRPWEMREFEHTLCEFDKYIRVLSGDGRMKKRYRPGLGAV
jgi:hypothetical protein